LPTILNIFLPVPQGVVGQGWGATISWEKHKPRSYTSIMDPLVLGMAQKVADKITTRPLETVQPGRLYLTASKDA